MVMTVLWFYGHVYFVTCGLRLKLESESELVFKSVVESKLV